MQLSQEQLIQIVREEIQGVLEDLGMLMPLPLDAEPTMNENAESKSKLFLAMQQASPKELKQACNAFGYYSRSQLSADITHNVLANIAKIKQAEKGTYGS